jgi:hypothetical protein
MRITKNNLIWYFIRSREQLPASYVRSCDKFFKSIGEKNVVSSKILRRDSGRNGRSWSVKRQATSMRKHQATSIKRQATSDKRLSKKRIKIHEAWALRMANGYKHQATSFRDPGTRVLTCDIMSRVNMSQAIKRQASSSKHPESGFKQQASSAKQ